MTETHDYRVEERHAALQDVVVGSAAMALGGLQAGFELVKQTMLMLPNVLYGHSDKIIFEPGDYRATVASLAVAGVGYAVQQRGVRHYDWVESQR